MKSHTSLSCWFAMASAILFLITIKASHAESKSGNCRIGTSTVKSMPGFKIQSMIGNWYAMQTTKRNGLLNCSQSVYESIDANSLKMMTITPNGTVEELSGILRQPTDSEQTGVSMVFSSEKIPGTSYISTVIDASWDSWVSIYSCLISGNSTTEYENLILSRNDHMSKKDTKNALKAFAKIGIDLSSFMKKKQGLHCN